MSEYDTGDDVAVLERPVRNRGSRRKNTQSSLDQREQTARTLTEFIEGALIKPRAQRPASLTRKYKALQASLDRLPQDRWPFMSPRLKRSLGTQ